MGKKDKNVVSDGDIKAGRRIKTGHTHIVSDGDMYVSGRRASAGRRVVSGGSARKCGACGGTSGWQITKQGGRTVTVHTGCGAVQ
jgi:hypothetical protein